MKYLEDMRIGERAEVGAHTFTAEDIKAFAKRFDPQSFHTDEVAAARSAFGALAASGWHTAAAWMRLMIDFRRREDDEMRARGEPVGAGGPSPGLRDLKWLKPVFAGDTVRYVTEIVGKRPSRSRPDWGLYTIRTIGTNQNGVDVLSFDSTGFVERRNAATPADRT